MIRRLKNFFLLKAKRKEMKYLHSVQRGFEAANLAKTILKMSPNDASAYHYLLEYLHRSDTQKSEYKKYIDLLKEKGPKKYYALYAARYHRYFSEWEEWEKNLDLIPASLHHTLFARNEFYLLDVRNQLPFSKTKENFQQLTHTKLLDLATLNSLILEHIRKAKPFLYLRLSDGEGTFFSLLSDLPFKRSTINGGLDQICDLMFRGINLKHDQLYDIAKKLETSYQSSTVVSLPTMDRIKTTENKAWRGFFGLSVPIDHLVKNNARHPSNFFTTVDSSTLGNIENIKNIALQVKAIGLITCHKNLSNLIEGWGATNIKTILIPPQPNTLSKKERKNIEPLYPNQYKQIIDKIKKPDEQRLYLVAAGIIGKEFCYLLYMQGHIVIDLGSSIDRLVGIESRGKYTRKPKKNSDRAL